MDNARLQPSNHPVDGAVGQSKSPANAPNGANQAARDFFRRGDSGQYEGGPAQRTLDSLPSWDLPERAPIIRTPKQQARRIATMWAEAILMLGCVAFLAAAVLKASSNTSTRLPPNSAGQTTQPAGIESRLAPVQAAKPVAPAMSRQDSDALAAVKPVRGVSPATEPSPLLPAAALVSTPVRKRATVSAAGFDPALPRAQSARQTNSTVKQPLGVANTGSPVVPKRAVAAFPDE